MPTHLLLTTGTAREDAHDRVRHFFARNFLVKYDLVRVIAAHTLAADAAGFWPKLEEGIAANLGLVTELLVELRAGGFEKLTDLTEMRQGYESKLLHTVTHLLDGFFGVDTVFYNLEEDSHGLSPRVAATIRANPTSFWLVETECTSNDGQTADQLDLIRKFESDPPR
ncbi:MAG: hypothetical protein HGA96_07055 [Desulfobulbaceae bacterium]|nr:hypothetical protein [Desulfobulbaceae bacterium]